MRSLLILACFLSACADAKTRPRPPAPGGLYYICSITNEEAAIFTLANGDETDPMPTGRSCDYEAYKAWREGWGPEPKSKRESPFDMERWQRGNV